ncbi:replicase protein [Phaius virus X]|uniref:RNA replication protein n=1 Tax=Phaius virus X TaxID=457382 RepID=B0I2Z2_9VIRU|nr:replicase protein [Phaius virus X]BAG06154.1 replicase protein [Phaius virus X]
MALLAAALDRFTDVSIKSVIQEEQLQNFRKALTQASTIMPYAASPAAANALEAMGIITNPFAAHVHTHAAAKAIENQLLKVVGLALPQEPVTFYFLKRQKLNALGRNPRLKDIFNNQLIEPRDFARYTPDTWCDHLIAPTTPIAYISDALHFLTPHFVMSMFKHNPVLKTLYATLVLPPEAMHRHPSQMPEVYTINYDYGGFQYLPGGHGGGAYHHEFSSLEWLKAGHLTYPDPATGRRLTVTVQMQESLGANHLFIFTRGKLLTPRVRTFSQNQSVVLPKLFHPTQLCASNPIPKTFAMQMLLYAKSVKEVTFRDIMAKIRQLIPTSELHRYQPDELIHIANYFYFVTHRDAICANSHVLDSSWFTQGFNAMAEKLKHHWREYFGKTSFEKLLAMLDWQVFTYSLEVEEIVVESPFFPKPGSVEDLRNDPWELPESMPEDSDSEDEAKPSTPPPQPIQSVDPDNVLPWSNCLHILKACGFQGNQRQYCGEEPIMPIKDIRKLPDAEAPDAPEELITRLKAIRRHPTLVTMDVSRGKAYASDVKNNRVGAVLRNETVEWKKNFATRVELGNRTLPVVVIHGAGGSGKSHVLQEFLRNQAHGYDQVGLVLPTVELRADWMAKVPKMKERNFRTFEKAMVQPSPRTVIMDDYSKLPAGYVEAFCLFHPEVRTLILTGDPQQTSHYEANDQAMSSKLAPAVEVFAPYCRYYLNATHRNKRDLANMLGVYGEQAGSTHITKSSTTLSGWPIIAPSLAKKTCLTELGHRAYSYAGCQGLTTPRVQILLDNNTALCSKEAMYTALSRARDAIHFINTGPNSTEYWQKLSATPYLKAFLDLHREEVATAVEAPAPAEPEIVPEPKTHFPATNAGMLLEPMKEALIDKYDRELLDSRHGYTNAIQTEDSTVQLFQHQQAKDEALLFKTIEARIKISSVKGNELEYVMKKDIGDILFLNYKRVMKLPDHPIPFCQELWDSSKAEVQARYLDKPIQNLINGKDRQCPDFPKQQIALFLKSQWVKKTEKIGAIPVKPGQTIASFMQETVMLYGTMARYMRRLRRAYQPSNIFITCENTPEELDSWVKERWKFSRPAHSNDFTAFDQSQDGAMLQFEVIKAKHHSIPEDIIESYVRLKTNAHIFLGVIAIMRLSGEGPTFDANTECAIAYHHTKYRVSDDTSQLYAGDDMAQDNTPILKESFSMISDKLTLTSKEVKHAQTPGEYATFCGWMITPQGILKEPKKLYASLALAKAIGKEDEVRVNYAHDLKHAYSMGDKLHDVLTEEQASYHQATTRELHLMGCNAILNQL